MISALEQDLTTSNNFYRQSYQTVMVTLIIAIVGMMLMAILIFYQLTHRPLPEFNAIAENNTKMHLEAYEEPNLLPATLLRWANKAAVAAYTFDFANYNQQIAAARPYFTNNGWVNYQSSVSQLIQEIVQRQLFVNSVVSGTPIISSQGNLPGVGYIWRLQLPFLVTYQTAETQSQDRFFVLLTITKVPTSDNPTGIGIDQFVMQKG